MVPQVEITSPGEIMYKVLVCMITVTVSVGAFVITVDKSG